MRAVVVYESMFGNTRVIAERIAEGMRRQFDVAVVAVGDAAPELLAGADVVVVGGPTHVHGLSSKRSRKGAVSVAAKDGSGLTLEPHATETGLRDWFTSVPAGDGRFSAAFDTRAKGPAIMTGRASHAIAHRLRHHGFHVGAVRSFLVEGDGHLVDGEADRAMYWGESVATVAAVSLRELRSASAA